MIHFPVTEGLLARGAEAPQINTSPTPQYALAELDYGMTIGVAVTQGGRQFVSWVGGGDDANAFMLLGYRDDGSSTWTAPCLVIDPHSNSLPCERCSIVGTLWIDPYNRLWFFFNQSLGYYDGSSTNWYIRCDAPDAEKLIWTEPRRIYYGCTLNKPTILSDGTWLLPVSVWPRDVISEAFSDCYHELDALRMAHVFASTDAGQNWLRRGGVAFPEPRFDEHMTLELSDGRLWMLGRTRNGLMESYSEDKGQSWSAPTPSKIKSVSSRFHLRRLHSGRILLIKHGIEIESAPEERSQLTAFLSEDDGQSWSSGLLLDERSGVSYPDADQDRSGRIIITYDRNRAQDGEILMALLREEDILSGCVHTPGAFTRRVILQPGKLRGR